MNSPDDNCAGEPIEHKVNVSKALLLFMAFNGDIDKTAVAMGTPVAVISGIATSNDWSQKLSELGRTPVGDPRSGEAAFNRAINYVQSHQMRAVVDVVLDYMEETMATEGGIRKLFFVQTKDGEFFSARALVDLVQAAQACQEMVLRALGDPAVAPKSASQVEELYVNVMKAMSAAEGVGLNSFEIVAKRVGAPFQADATDSA
jgi:hypothetical protein